MVVPPGELLSISFYPAELVGVPKNGPCPKTQNSATKRRYSWPNGSAKAERKNRHFSGKQKTLWFTNVPVELLLRSGVTTSRRGVAREG
jgi:hypothetical protein